MPFTVTEPTIELHNENQFYRGDLHAIVEEDGKYGLQLKWVIRLDEDGTYVNDEGTEVPREVWTWTSPKLTTHDKNRFRQYVKGLTGKEPVKGELFDERHYTKTFYEDNPLEDPTSLTGSEKPWRVAVMFNHVKKPDGTPGERVSLLVGERQLLG